MPKKTLHFIAWLIILSNLALLVLVAYWLLKSYPMTYAAEPIPILNKNRQIARNEAIIMELHIVKNNNYSPTSSSTILCDDGSLFNLASRGVNLPNGEYTLISRSYVVPLTTSVGATCKFKFTNTYKVNPIRTQTKIWESETFKIIKE